MKAPGEDQPLRESAQRPTSCGSCGRRLVGGTCLPCELVRWTGLLRQEFGRLTILIAIAAVVFWGTHLFAQSNARLRRDQAAAWFAIAQDALRGGHGIAAVSALRRSVSRDPGRLQYRLALAEALAASHLDDEARRELLALRDAQPEDADTNLQLARIEARRGSPDAARRFYESAIAGQWRPEQIDVRRATRIELIDFLLAHNARARALSELLVLDANLPDDPALQARVGEMFLHAGDPRRALEHFRLVLRKQPGSATASRGAGHAAFELGDYRAAVRYFDALPRTSDADADDRDVAALVLGSDPLAPRLSADERRRRLTAAAEVAMAAVEACLAKMPSVPELAQARDRMEPLISSLAKRTRQREAASAIDDGLELVYRAEGAAAERCGQPTSAPDRALLLIGRLRGFEGS